MKTDQKQERFRLGRMLATPGALAALSQSGEALKKFLERHQCGDWGETCPEDAQSNEEALECSGRIFSVYLLRNGIRIWIITDADRAATTALLPSEY